MKKIFFRGAGPALVTPFKSDGSVDYEAYASLVRRQVEGGADFLVALATSAEAPVLSAEENFVGLYIFLRTVEKSFSIFKPVFTCKR